jgi:putative transposase
VDSMVEVHGGVQPVLAALEGSPAEIASSTYYAAKSRPASARAMRDQVLIEEIKRVWVKNKKVYGARKVWHQMGREGHEVARCTVERLMRAEGLRGVVRDKSPRTTRPAAETERPFDLVKRDFTVTRPNELWVADLTYVKTAAGWVYVAFVLDVYSRMIVGWQASTSLYTDLALDALQMGIWRRQAAGQDLSGLVHHSDRGVQYRALRYTQRLDDEDAVASVGSKGDSYDNAMAEALNSLFKAECVRGPAYRPAGGWREIDEVEFAVMDWVGWYNETRLHSELGQIPPLEHEAAYWAARASVDTVTELDHDEHDTAVWCPSTDDANTPSHSQADLVLATGKSN